MNIKLLPIFILVLVELFCTISAVSQNKIDNLVLIKGTIKVKKISDSGAKEQIINDAIVRFTDEKFKVYQTKTNEKGKFEINLPAGTYQVYSAEDTNCLVCAEFVKNNVLITNKRKIKLNILLLFVGEG